MQAGRLKQASVIGFILFSLLALWWRPAGAAYGMIFPLLPLFVITRRNSPISVPVLILLNLLASVINAVFLDTFNLPVTLPALVALAGVEATALWLFRPKKLNLTPPIGMQPYLYGIYGLFGLAVVARLFSVLHLQAPILHDPQAHAFWASKIVSEQSIDYFYSPGLHVWSATIHQAFGISTAQATHILSNLLSAVTVLSFGLATLLITRRGRIGLWVALLTLLAPLPAFLYFMAGKNALVAAVPFIPLVWLFTAAYFRRSSFLSGLLLTISVLGVGLVHYPAYAYAAGALGLYIAASYMSTHWRTLKSRLLLRLKHLFILFLPLVLSLAWIGGNMYLTGKEEPDIPLVSSRAEAKAYHETAGASADVPAYPDPSQAEKPSQSKKQLHGPLSSLRQLSEEYVSFVGALPRDIGLIGLGVSLSGLYFLIAAKPVTERLRSFKTILLSSVLGAALVMFALTVYPVLGTTRDTGFLIMPLILSLPAAWLFANISRRRLVEYVVIIILAVMATLFTFRMFRHRSLAAVVGTGDMQAFAWIDQNVSDNKKFIGQSRLDPNRKSVVFSVDGALWLPVFTGNAITTPFHELRFLSLESHVNYERTRQLSTGEPVEVAAAVTYFLENDYEYLYVDGPGAHQEFRVDYLTRENFAELVYQNRSVSIYRLRQP